MPLYYPPHSMASSSAGLSFGGETEAAFNCFCRYVGRLAFGILGFFLHDSSSHEPFFVLRFLSPCLLVRPFRDFRSSSTISPGLKLVLLFRIMALKAPIQFSHHSIRIMAHIMQQESAPQWKIWHQRFYEVVNKFWTVVFVLVR